MPSPSVRNYPSTIHRAAVIACAHLAQVQYREYEHSGAG